MEERIFSCKIGITPCWIEELSMALMERTQTGYTASGYQIIKCWAHPSVAEGVSCYLQLNENMAVHYSNLQYHSPVHLHMLNDDGYCLLHFSQQENLYLPSSPALLPPSLTDTVTLLNCARMQSTYPGMPGKSGNRQHGICLIMKKKPALKMGVRLLNKATLYQLFNSPLHAIFMQHKMDSRACKIIHELDQINIRHAAFGLHLTAATYSLLAGFQDMLTNQPLLTTHKVYGADEHAINSTAAYITDNIEAEFPGLEELAMKANMSVSKYKLLFGKIYGIAPKQLFIEKQLEHAKKLLESGKYKVVEVCQQLGYSNPGFFSRQFRKKFGISPRGVSSCDNEKPGS